MVDGWSPERGIYEQFAGYFDLEPLLMAEVAAPPVAVDVLLGTERVAGSQLIKQADVLMLHHLVPEEVVSGSLEPCLSFYEPRTAHGSSLSPAIYASLFARAGNPDRALELFRLAARLDLDDRTGTTAGGLHMATMGGVWQALAYGFLGLRADGRCPRRRPLFATSRGGHSVSPSAFVARRWVSAAEHDRVTIACDAPLAVKVDQQRTRITPPGAVIPFTCQPAAEERSPR